MERFKPALELAKQIGSVCLDLLGKALHGLGRVLVWLAKAGKRQYQSWSKKGQAGFKCLVLLLFSVLFGLLSDPAPISVLISHLPLVSEIFPRLPVVGEMLSQKFSQAALVGISLGLFAAAVKQWGFATGDLKAGYVGSFFVLAATGFTSGGLGRLLGLFGIQGDKARNLALVALFVFVVVEVWRTRD